MSELIAYFNGEFVPESQCVIHATDRGFRTSDVVYDLQRTFGGKLYRLREHLQRFERSLKFTRLEPGLDIDQLEALTNEVVERNRDNLHPGGDISVTQFVTRGKGATVTQATNPTVCIMPQHIDLAALAPLYQDGAHVVISRTRAYPVDSLDPKVKHYSRMNFVLASLEAADVDPDAYPVLLDTDGNIAEHIAGNFYIVTDGVLRMPGDRSVLQGDTRRAILQMAGQLGIPTVEEDLQPYDAYTADEVFLTNTTYCILPAGRIDNRSVGADVPGPVTRQLQSAWSEMVGVDFVDQALNYNPPY
ncbi:MAG: aminotransferase class IV [SAR202 cluster bacterium]|jgi:branched-chain amino acid aminotransferase|nr:aminotransferase class IV [SAR202 cluster bacterium]MDP6715191.1 aminotransferase class IV [SAR202 cluster bacterium]